MDPLTVPVPVSASYRMNVALRDVLSDLATVLRMEDEIEVEAAVGPLTVEQFLGGVHMANESEGRFAEVVEVFACMN